jgi:hypothetical protein
MRTTLAAVGLSLHGLIHLIGFTALAGIAVVDGFAYRTTVLGGAVSIGDAGARILGVAWLLLAVGFVLAAAGVLRRAPVARRALAPLAIASSVACALALPEAAFGIAFNVAILVALAWSSRRPAGDPARPAARAAA